LIKYHLFHIRKYETVGQRDSKIHMYLLYGNKGIEDVIDYAELKEYEKSSRGMLKISFVFSNAPPATQPGIHGTLTSDTIQRWLDDINTKKSPTTPTSTNKERPISSQQSTSTILSQNLVSSPTNDDNISVNYFSQSKIVVCGKFNMMISVEQALTNMGYSENDYILLI
jgi:NAD(P)H-flavin reductase